MSFGAEPATRLPGPTLALDLAERDDCLPNFAALAVIAHTLTRGLVQVCRTTRSRSLGPARHDGTD